MDYELRDYELRKVPPDWKHPTYTNGQYIPLSSLNFETEAADWDEEAQKFREGLVFFGPTQKWIPKKEVEAHGFQVRLHPRPEEAEYMPNWPNATHFQMYEKMFNEVTPVSPVMETPEKLAVWCCENMKSQLPQNTCTYDNWLNLINRSL